MLNARGRTKKTALVLLTNLLTTIITSMFSLVINYKVLATLGSDYNGVNSTAAQVITILSLIEGGFTLAAQVALYKPVAQGDNNRISQLVTHAAQKMRVYGLWTLIIGVAVSCIYAGLVKSSLTYFSILCVMLLAVIGAAFNLGAVSQYRILFQVTQTEYKCGYLNIVSQFMLYFAVCFVLNRTNNIVAVRMVYLLVEVLRGIAIVILAQKSFVGVDYHANVDGIQLKGTREVFVAKITTLIYESGPVLFISTFIGTASTSVYALYLSITNIVLSVLTSIVNAPTHGLGQLIAEGSDKRNHQKLIEVYTEYEIIIATANAFLCSVTFVMLKPFVGLYTGRVTDINYVDIFYCVVMVLILLIQVLHMPSGICINVAGRFKAVRNIQLVASIVLIFSIIIGVILGGLKGLLFGKLFTATVLAIIEVCYNYIKVIQCTIVRFVKVLLTTYLPTIVVCFVEVCLVSQYVIVDSWVVWVLLGGAVFAINAMYFLLINFVFNRKVLKSFICRFVRKQYHLGG